LPSPVPHRWRYAGPKFGGRGCCRWQSAGNLAPLHRGCPMCMSENACVCSFCLFVVRVCVCLCVCTRICMSVSLCVCVPEGACSACCVHVRVKVGGYVDVVLPFHRTWMYYFLFIVLPFHCPCSTSISLQFHFIVLMWKSD
jgi:hypothetical protein